MILNRNNILRFILAFMVLVNILVAFDINEFYIRAILAFVFIITIPGLLIMLIMRIREVGFWEYLVYTVGLSVAFIMFAGLAVNWILPWLNITDKPLSLWPILISFNIFLLIMLLFAYRRNQDLNVDLKAPKLDVFNQIFFIIPMLFPVMAVLGAFILNNDGPNTLTMIMLGSIAAYVLAVVIFRKRLNENIYPWALWMMSLALLMSGWMRSWYVSGVDINLEFHIFETTKNLGYWSISNFYDAYNAMLSVNLLPTIYSIIIDISNEFIFKLIIPTIFSFISIIIYLVSKKLFNYKLAFLSSFLFIIQPAFLSWFSIPIRQEIAFLFFSLSVLSIFYKGSNKIRNFLIISFGICTVLSHYSTNYILILILLTLLILEFIYDKFFKSRDNSVVFEKKISLILFLIILFFTFFWYTQITNISSGALSFSKKSFSNLENLFTQDVQNRGQSPLEQFDFTLKKIDITSALREYINETSKNYRIQLNINDSVNQINESYNPRFANAIVGKSNIDYNITRNIVLFGEFLKKLIKFFIIIGFILLLIQIRKNKYDLNFTIVAISFFIILVFITILPFISVNYDLLRTYQQILIVISCVAILGMVSAFKFLKNNNLIYVVSGTVLILFFLISSSGFVYQLVGGTHLFMITNNKGLEYDLYYTHRSEIHSAQWTITNLDSNSRLYANNYANTKIYLAKDFDSDQIIYKDILPQYVGRRSYLYLSFANKMNRLGFIAIKGNTISIAYPYQQMVKSKNKIYNNGESEVLR